MPGWLTATAVAQHANVAGVTGSSVPLVTCCAAAESWIETTARPDLDWTGVGFTTPAPVLLGGLMLAWRWYQRRDASPFGGVIGPTGDPVQLLRSDPDIAQLLGVGAAPGSAFVFGAGLIDEDQALVTVDLVDLFEDGLE